MLPFVQFKKREKHSSMGAFYIYYSVQKVELAQRITYDPFDLFNYIAQRSYHFIQTKF